MTVWEIFWISLAALQSVASVVVLGLLVYSSRTLGKIALMTDEELGPLPDPAPRVCMVVAGRNEEKYIEAGVRSLLEQDYPNLEIVAVNDRSTDRTGEILDRLAAESSRIRVVHVENLPSGWLGKCHAMWLAADQSQGEWLLFTDADVVMKPDTVARAVRYAVQNGVDHVVLFPEAKMQTFMAQVMVVAFFIFFTVFVRPWAVKNPKSKAHVGVGAFNLLRRSVYEAIGTHRAIAMRPDDDLKLGKLVKIHGYSQHPLSGVGQYLVPWYDTARQMIHGLEKNSFAAVDYSVFNTVMGVFFVLLCTCWPFLAGTLGWLFLPQIAAAMYGAISLMLFAAAVMSCRENRTPWNRALLFPVATLIFAFIQVNSMYATLRQGGIRWRGTLYPLAELKANRV